MPLVIPFETEGFPPGTVPNGISSLTVTWDDLLWAAVTVGRPNRQYVFRHGDASIYEAIFRWSLVRMSLEQSGPGAYRLRRTNAARTLDPTEKGAVNYFLGMTFCKLFAARLLNSPWLLHLDVFRPFLNPVLTGRSRPDLLGMEHGTNRWHAFECKGRISPPGPDPKQKAKDQALRLVSVNGTPCSLHIGAITHFRNEVLHFYWRDPQPGGEGFEVPFDVDAWHYYYAPVMEVISGTDRVGAMQRYLNTFAPVEGLDIEMSIHPSVAEPLFREQWDLARLTASSAADQIVHDGYQRDGLWIKAGDSWNERFKDFDFGNV